MNQQKNNLKSKTTDGAEHTVAKLLSQEGFSVAVVRADVTLEELEEILPTKKRVAG